PLRVFPLPRPPPSPNPFPYTPLFRSSQPGHGVCVVERGGVRLGVVNLSGNLYLKAGRSAFTEIESALGELDGAHHVIVDMHAERSEEHTSELQSPDHLVCRRLLEKKI